MYNIRTLIDFFLLSAVNMNSMTVVMLLCLVAAAYAHSVGHVAESEPQAQPDALAADAEAPEQESSLRNKRSLLLLKKKLLLGTLNNKLEPFALLNN